ncbi:MAG: response regulator, partial [Leptospiraceae bacterium]|nr:response regulator [Leptospiraceae bacterium]
HKKGLLRSNTELFPLHSFRLEAGEKILILYEIQSNVSLKLPMNLYSARQFKKESRQKAHFLFFIYGFLISIIVFNLILFFVMKDRSFIYFIFLIISLGFYNTGFDGILLFYLKPEYGKFYLPLILIFANLSFLFLLLFTRIFMGIKKGSNTEYILNFSIVFTFLFIFYALYKPTVTNKILYPWSLLISIEVIVISIIQYKKGFSPAFIFLFSNLVLPISIFILSLTSFGFTSYNLFTKNIMKLSYILQALIFTIAIARRIKVLESNLQHNLQDEIHKHVVLLRHEVEEKGIAQNKLILAKENAENALKVKSEFLANMSHEIRTPMNALMGMAQLLEATELSKEQIGYLNYLKIGAKDLLKIINDILDYSKIESGKMEIENIVFNLKTAMLEIVTLFSSEAKKRNNKLSLMPIESEVPEYIKADSTRLKQIINNLLSNAIKFTENGEIYLQVKLEKEVENKLSFSVIDTGIGISKSDIEKIFDPFTQSDSSITRKHGGTGLGLSICKKLVNLMGGEIWVESMVKKGSVFSFSISYEMPGDLEIRSYRYSEQKTGEIKNIRMSTDMKEQSIMIMVAEDNEINRILAKKVFKKMGYSITLAQNGQEVLELMENEKFDIIFMDIQMPILDGLETTEQIRKTYGGSFPIIIALTANALAGDKEKYLAKGMNDYISKPLEVENLQHILKKWEKILPNR